MANNPFEVEVVNPLQALLLGQQAYDKGIKANKERAQETALSEAGQLYAAGDPRGAFTRLLSTGQFQGANTLQSADQNQWTRTHTEGRDKVADQHWSADYGLRKAAGDRAGEDKFGIKDVTDPNTGVTSFVKYNTRTGEVTPTGPQGITPPSDPAMNPKSPFNTAMMKQDAERVNSYSEGSKLAEEGGATLDQIDALRKQAFTAPVLGPIASKVGYPANQALDAATNQLSLDVAQKMKGSLSDKDIAFIKSQVPTASTGGAAGDAASGLIRSGFERTKQRAAFYRTWAEQNGGINGADAAWSKYISENPLTMEDKTALGGRRFNPDYNRDFSPYIKTRGARGITQQQYDALPSGTPFTAPDGSQRIKP